MQTSLKNLGQATFFMFALGECHEKYQMAFKVLQILNEIIICSMNSILNDILGPKNSLKAKYLAIESRNL